jgi:hypothetical protein
LAADYYDEVASGIKDNPGAEGSKSTAADRRAFNRERARFLREGTGNPPKKLFDFLKDHETAVPDATPTDAPPTDAPPTDAPPTDATPAKKPGTDPGEPQGCFVAGTMVLTPGGLRPIETLAVGGAIICSDPDVLEKRTCEVASVMRHTVPAVLRVIVGASLQWPSVPSFCSVERGRQRRSACRPQRPCRRRPPSCRKQAHAPAA